MPLQSKQHKTAPKRTGPQTGTLRCCSMKLVHSMRGRLQCESIKIPDKPKRPADRSGVRICLAWSGLRDLNPRSLGPKPSAIPNFAKPGWIRFWRRGFGRCGESTGYYIRFAWKMQPPFFGRHGCFTDGAVVFFGRQGCFFQRGEAFAPKSFPLRGRCRRRRRRAQKRDEFHPQVLPLEGKVSPQATEEVSYRIAVSFDECESGTKITSSVIRLAGRDALCIPPRKGRDFTRSPLRRAQKRNENHLFRHPACGGRRMPPSPQGDRRAQKRDEFHPQVLPLEGKVSPQATEEVSYRIAVSFDGCKNGTKITSSVIRLAGDAGCHPPRKGRDF